ncbi:uncharacterized protein Gasu_61530 [Galdieria sulphuraria]|uniref:Uncharacterized protein n=1 Tax=Galdieria sulphuraria TaxID=130081 RepID=M2VST1_GALSU|nr:uncharacterized protein Gasu_61530 [Galdieria sulphuraria]EME26211.1 hypothetical protein Gasu_61530 [Galdieria sulphuraria]|eukprot:XP_005702731.1 hypothetical protein Gasu_61530 [Galdieria sulphuraria]
MGALDLQCPFQLCQRMKTIDKSSWPLREFVLFQCDSWLKSKYSTVLQLTRCIEESRSQNKADSKRKLKLVVKDSTGQVLERHLLSISPREYPSSSQEWTFVMKRFDTRLMFCREKTKTRFAIALFKEEEAIEAANILNDFVFTDTGHLRGKKKVQDSLPNSQRDVETVCSTEIKCTQPPEIRCPNEDVSNDCSMMINNKQLERNTSIEMSLKPILRSTCTDVDTMEMRNLICLHTKRRLSKLPNYLNLFK